MNNFCFQLGLRELPIGVCNLSFSFSFECGSCEEPTNGSFRGLGKTQDDEGQVGKGHNKGGGVEE
jgi:hypothetical protein